MHVSIHPTYPLDGSRFAKALVVGFVKIDVCADFRRRTRSFSQPLRGKRPSPMSAMRIPLTISKRQSSSGVLMRYNPATNTCSELLIITVQLI